jgi:type II secretory pathway component PulF
MAESRALTNKPRSFSNEFNRITLNLRKRRGLAPQQRRAIYERVRAIITEGVSVYNGLDRLHQRYSSRKDSRALVYNEWLNMMRGGSSFTAALRGWVPEHELILLDAGERGGNLEVGLTQALQVLEVSTRIRNAVIGAVSYPAILVAALIGILVYFATVLLPVFADTIPPNKWVGASAMLRTIAEGVVNYGVFIGLGFAGLVFIIGHTMPRWTGAVRAYFDRVPPWSVFKRYQAAAYLASLSSMIQSGISLEEGLSRIQKNASPWLRQHNGTARVRLRAGQPPGQALALPLFDVETLDDLAIYGGLSSFEQVLSIMATRVAESTIKRMNAFAKAMNTVMLLLIGGMVVWIFYSLYDLASAIGSGI